MIVHDGIHFCIDPRISSEHFVWTLLALIGFLVVCGIAIVVAGVIAAVVTRAGFIYGYAVYKHVRGTERIPIARVVENTESDSIDTYGVTS